MRVQSDEHVILAKVIARFFVVLSNYYNVFEDTIFQNRFKMLAANFMQGYCGKPSLQLAGCAIIQCLVELRPL